MSAFKGPDIALVAVTLVVPVILVASWERAAAARIETAPAEASGVATAAAAEDDYCSAELKKVVRRVASS